MWLGCDQDVARMWLGCRSDVLSDVGEKVWQKLRERGFKQILLFWEFSSGTRKQSKSKSWGRMSLGADVQADVWGQRLWWSGPRHARKNKHVGHPRLSMTQEMSENLGSQKTSDKTKSTPVPVYHRKKIQWKPQRPKD